MAVLSDSTPVVRDRRELFAYTLRTLKWHVLIAIAGPFLTALLCAASRLVFGDAVSVAHVVSDTTIYFRYASAFLNGQVPYRDFVVEWPILSLPFMLIPRFLASSLPGYHILFALQMLLVDGIAIYLIAWAVATRQGSAHIRERLRWYTVYIAALSPVVFSRYDLAPMVLTLAAVLTWFSNRNAVGGLLAGLGALMKIYPAVMLGPAVLWEASRRKVARWRGTLAFLGSVALGAALWLGLTGKGAGSFFRYHLQRGLEIESAYSGCLMVLAKVSGAPLGTRFQHGAEELITPWSGQVAALSFPLQVAALLLVTWLFYRSGMKDSLRYCGAAVMAFAITAKVLSPQYLIWLLPFFTLLDTRSARLLRWGFLVCCIATVTVYPGALAGLKRFTPLAIGLLNLRNLLLIGLWCGLLLPSNSGRSPASGSETG